MSAVGLGRVKTFSCKRSELDEVATRAIFPDFDYALIAAISGRPSRGSRTSMGHVSIALRSLIFCSGAVKADRAWIIAFGLDPTYLVDCTNLAYI
jgi:hypothetical protein